MECLPLNLVVTRNQKTEPPGYALTAHNTRLTMKTTKVCTGYNQAITLNCKEGNCPVRMVGLYTWEPP